MDLKKEGEKLADYSQHLTLHCLDELLRLIKKHRLNGEEVALIFSGNILFSLNSLFKDFIKKLDSKSQVILKKQVFEEFELMLEKLKGIENEPD